MKKLEEFKVFLELRGYSEMTIISCTGIIQRFFNEIDRNIEEITIEIIKLDRTDLRDREF